MVEAAQQPDFSVLLWVRTSCKTDGFPAIATDKAWDGGRVVDFISRQNSGLSLDSGVLPGWALAIQPDGSWTWNLGDGEKRLDYLPTAGRQPLWDGHWHQLAFSINPQACEARLYYDGGCVAVYSLTGMGEWKGDQKPQPGDFDGEVHDFRILDGVIDPLVVEEDWRKQGNTVPVGPPDETPERVRLMSWNIWNGGREEGRPEGVERTAEIIHDAGADIVAMQETYGSGPQIADTLGFHFYLRSSNLSVMSRFPILQSHDLFDDPFRFGGVTLDLGGGALLRVFSLWIHYLPDFCSSVQQEDVTADRLIVEEQETRGPEILGILEAVQPLLNESDRTPLVIAGDFNSPSHLDWDHTTRHLHRNMEVAWPVSSAMLAVGFTDAYRQVHPDPASMAGRTWTPRFPETWQDRIDYVYYHGRGVVCEDACVLDKHPIRWPSDHAAVLTTLRIR